MHRPPNTSCNQFKAMKINKTVLFTLIVFLAGWYLPANEQNITMTVQDETGKSSPAAELRTLRDIKIFNRKS
ncbi:MAG: hypothetical protein RL090_1954 [Bacteroidota bacterium]